MDNHLIAAASLQSPPNDIYHIFGPALLSYSVSSRCTMFLQVVYNAGIETYCAKEEVTMLVPLDFGQWGCSRDCPRFLPVTSRTNAVTQSASETISRWGKKVGSPTTSHTFPCRMSGLRNSASLSSTIKKPPGPDLFDQFRRVEDEVKTYLTLSVPCQKLQKYVEKTFLAIHIEKISKPTKWYKPGNVPLWYPCNVPQYIGRSINKEVEHSMALPNFSQIKKANGSAVDTLLSQPPTPSPLLEKSESVLEGGRWHVRSREEKTLSQQQTITQLAILFRWLFA
ncbi:hypothetical protein CDAR_486021 [Caerostris darwini]|uniref:Uncharacterized protein n=1 Tax=Caerostris darwini TaxID=1538125 RepID=A0AAV4WK42_9ARAC|nr:hypothetical protein CDAR_486021 [Caerostris darwini]